MRVAFSQAGERNTSRFNKLAYSLDSSTCIGHTYTSHISTKPLVGSLIPWSVSLCGGPEPGSGWGQGQGQSPALAPGHRNPGSSL